MKHLIIQSDLETLAAICSDPGEYIEHFKLISKLGSPFYWQQWDEDSGFLFTRLHQSSVEPEDILDFYEYWQLWDNQMPERITDSDELVEAIPSANDANLVGVSEFTDFKRFISTFRGSNIEIEDIKGLLGKLYGNSGRQASYIDEIADSLDDDE